ncbi:MAG: D-serine ammonia-lyase [Bacillota bacterium]
MTEKHDLEQSMNEQRMEAYPLLRSIQSYIPVIWFQHEKNDDMKHDKVRALSEKDILDAERRWKRFATLLSILFPETAEQHGIIESPLRKIEGMRDHIQRKYDTQVFGNLYLKCDSELPVAGSIKARGGIYEVLKHAESLAIEKGMLKVDDHYGVMASPEFRSFFNQYKIAVGSTGNLGLSIGIIGAALGFHVTVHMSADAKAWKKQLLREKGVTVIEYASDYSKAVEEGRKQSDQDPMSYFVDDEQSKELFLGYSVAAYRLKEQLDQQGILVDQDHPLVVYLPCGVGGAPGGITFGLKTIFGEHVHCFFAEPTHSPCMLLGLMTKQHEKISVNDFGLDNITEADGLAVGTPSGFVCRTVGDWIAGVFTVADEELYPILTGLMDTESLKIEPSAAAGLLGPIRLNDQPEGKKYLQIPGATHVAWATGGLFVPPEQMLEFYERGKIMTK